VEREDLVDTIRALDRQIKLKNLVLDNFVPLHYIELIEQRAIFDERNDTWIIPGLERACNNIRRDLAPPGAETGAGAGAGAGGGGGAGGRMYRRPAQPNYARLAGSSLMGPAVGRGMPFDPSRVPELSGDILGALLSTMAAEDGERQPKDMFYTYGATDQPEADTATRGGRRKRR